MTKQSAGYDNVAAINKTFLKSDISSKSENIQLTIPAVSLPKGGGAIKGIDEKFSVNTVNGTSALSIPLPFSKVCGVIPALTLSYNSGNGNSISGLSRIL